MDPRKSIILTTRNFPPMRGGMEWLNFHIYKALGKAYDTYLIGPHGAEQFCPEIYNVRTNPALPVWLFLVRAFWQTLILALKVRPKLIIAGSGVAAFPAVLAGKLTCVPVLTYLHGLDIVSTHPIYRRFFVPVIRRSSAWLVNSRFTQQAAIRAGIPAEKIEILHPGTDLPDELASGKGEKFRERIQAGERPILLNIGRLTRRKGLLEFIESAMPEIVRQCPNVLLVIIGSEPTQSVAGVKESISERLRSRLVELGLEENARFMDWIDDQKLLKEAYQASQVHIFPVLDLPDEGEGFGMVAVEAAAHGVPTVAFDVGGIPDAVEDGVSGYLVPSGDYMRLAGAIIEYLKLGQEAAVIRNMCRQHAERFGWQHFGESLRQACARLAT